MVYREDGSRLPRSENALLRAWGAVEAVLVEHIRAGVTTLAGIGRRTWRGYKEMAPCASLLAGARILPLWRRGCL